TQKLAGPGVEHRFHEALGFAQRDCLAVADEWEFADLYLVAGFPGPGFGQADAGDLRVAIGAARDVEDVHRMWMDILVAERARDCLDRDDPFVTGLVRQPGRRGDVSDRRNA